MNTLKMKTKAKSNLKALRKRNDYTQQKLADLLGIHVTTYNKIELGLITLDIKKAQQLAHLYAVSLEVILQDLDSESNLKAQEPKPTYVEQEPIRLIIEIDGQKIENERLPSLIQKLEALIAEENKRSKG
tara:strand:- start:236 stop:625 length:390 start_codon:yes stop_codon:yes gene_type:complete